MANEKRRKITGFQFQPFSEKQLKLLSWWADDSPVKDKFMCVADGSVRSSKSTICTLSFLLYTMSHFDQQNMAIAGKTVGSLRRNILVPLKQICLTLKYDVIEHRSENYIEIHKGRIVNYYYLFGGRSLPRFMET